MKIRIFKIEGCDSSQNVLLYRNISAEGDVIVTMIAWHTYEDQGDLIQEENMEFTSALMAERFICDFSEVSANEFANSFQP